MYAIRQVQRVRNHTVMVHLPKDFLTDRVEVIVLPAQPSSDELGATKANQVSADVHRFLTMDTSRFTAVQRQAYNRACAIIRQGRNSDEPRILGLFAGLVQIADDFDAPLVNEGMFWGADTDEYGASLET